MNPAFLVEKHLPTYKIIPNDLAEYVKIAQSESQYEPDAHIRHLSNR